MQLFLDVFQINWDNESSLESEIEMQRYDGWYNNLAHPAWGSIGELIFKLIKNTGS